MHDMNIVVEHEGTQEWMCPICGRILLISWQPHFKRVVIEAGMWEAKHRGFLSRDTEWQ